MAEGVDGLPLTAADGRSRTLDVRVPIDIQADEAGLVRPGSGGMSVSPNDVKNLPKSRLPPEFGGTGKDPAWYIEVEDLGRNLAYKPDPNEETHGYIEPVRTMTLKEYESELHATALNWHKIGGKD